MQAVLTLPSGPLAEACVSLARTTESLPIVDHSIRSFLYAAYLTQRGVFIDVGHDTHIPLERLQVVRDTYPRPAHDRSIRDAILEHASRSEAAAPPNSIAAELLRQKRAEGELRLGALEQPDPERARVASGSKPGWCQCSGATMLSA